jgi:hypothetical protein
LGGASPGATVVVRFSMSVRGLRRRTDNGQRPNVSNGARPRGFLRTIGACYHWQRMRPFVIAVLVAQLALSATPAGALLVCVSVDGSASIEVAAPGTTRCAECDCEVGVIDDEGHCCHDIPVVLSAQALLKAPAAAAAVMLPLVALPIAPGLDALLVGRAPIARVHGAPPGLRALRSVILTL